jgi:hypothetical protein
LEVHEVDVPHGRQAVDIVKVELHCHTSRHSECATVAPEPLIAHLVEAGYDAVYLTEHDAVWPADELADLQDQFPEIRIFPGLELTISYPQLQHLLILGTSDPGYLELNCKGAAAIERARRRGHLTVLAHPYRWEGGAEVLDGDVLPDAIEHRTCNQPDSLLGQEAARSAEALGLRLINAGDVHALHFVDRFWIETHRSIERAEDIRDIVLEGAYDLRIAGD